MRRYAITEGLGAERALEFAVHNLKRAVDIIQIREKALNVHDLRDLVASVMRLASMSKTLIFVNGADDFGAHGVHLPAGLSSRNKLNPIPHAASGHSVPEVVAAEADGAAFVVFGPVFATGTKTPVGLDALRSAAAAVRVPVFALGGVTEENAASCIAAGAAGIAGIRLFRP
ncbi:MAG: thiamine phosphate synthase [Acidobacteriota bacterium]|nr:thiamine phosphate synthase [Acidobacteriota bacterium]